jgi:hypothetical protein
MIKLYGQGYYDGHPAKLMQTFNMANAKAVPGSASYAPSVCSFSAVSTKKEVVKDGWLRNNIDR